MIRALHNELIQATINNDFMLLSSKLNNLKRKEECYFSIMSIPYFLFFNFRKNAYVIFKKTRLDSINEKLLPLDNITLLHIAALFDSLECFVILERYGFKIDCKSVDDYQPLHYACMLGALEVTSYILSQNPKLATVEVLF